MDIAVIVGIVGGICTIAFSYLAYLRGKTKDTSNQGEIKGTMLSDIGYIKGGIDDLKREQKDFSKTLSDHADRITRCEVKIDKLEQGE